MRRQAPTYRCGTGSAARRCRTAPGWCPRWPVCKRPARRPARLCRSRLRPPSCKWGGERRHVGGATARSDWARNRRCSARGRVRGPGASLSVPHSAGRRRVSPLGAYCLGSAQSKLASQTIRVLRGHRRAPCRVGWSNCSLACWEREGVGYTLRSTVRERDAVLRSEIPRWSGQLEEMSWRGRRARRDARSTETYSCSLLAPGPVCIGIA